MTEVPINVCAMNKTRVLGAVGAVAGAALTLGVVLGVYGIADSIKQQGAAAAAAQEAADVQAAYAEKFAAATPSGITKTPPPAPVVEAAPAPVEAAPVEAAPVVEEPAAPAGPILCPAGTTVNSSDGYNDTSCAPDVCLTMTLPNPDYPQCDYFYPPEYYY